MVSGSRPSIKVSWLGGVLCIPLIAAPMPLRYSGLGSTLIGQGPAIKFWAAAILLIIIYNTIRHCTDDTEI